MCNVLTLTEVLLVLLVQIGPIVSETNFNADTLELVSPYPADATESTIVQIAAMKSDALAKVYQATSVVQCEYLPRCILRQQNSKSTSRRSLSIFFSTLSQRRLQM